MARQIIGGFHIYQALKAEGFELPPECGDVQLELPVDGVIRLHYTELMTGERLAMVGRALIRLAQEGTPFPDLGRK